MFNVKNRMFNVTRVVLFGATSLVTLHLTFDAVGIVGTAYGAEDCHDRPADNPCTPREQIDYNTSTINLVGEAAMRNLQSIIDVEAENGNYADAISANSGRIDAAFTQLDTLTEDVSELKSGVAMAVAIANAPVVRAPGKKFSVSGGVGYYDTEIAAAIKFAVVPTDFSAVNVSVGYDFGDNYTLGAGAGFAF